MHLDHFWFLKFFFTIFGLLIGSFLNVVIYRMPKNESVVFPASRCPKCGHVIKWYENIPVLSYLIFLRGKCSNCKTEIPLQYPIIESIVGVFGFLLAPKYLTTSELIHFVFYFSYACGFLAHFLIDIRYKILPDKINLYLLLITIPYAYFFQPLNHVIVGGLIGFGGPYAITWLFWKLRGQIGLGGGDIKLYGILGLILGPIGILNTIFLSCTLGAVFGLILIGLKKMDKQTALPFGPFIIAVAVLQIFFPSLAQYLDFFALS